MAWVKEAASTLSSWVAGFLGGVFSSIDFDGDVFDTAPEDWSKSNAKTGFWQKGTPLS
jgi:hypothetical protein